MKIEASPIQVENTGKKTDDGRLIWRLTAPVVVRIGDWRIEVPSGFEFDFASCPRFLGVFLDQQALFGLAPCVHDWLYKVGAPKLVADALFRVLLEFEKVPKWQAWVMEIAVRYGGGAAYRAHRRREKREANK